MASPSLRGRNRSTSYPVPAAPFTTPEHSPNPYHATSSSSRGTSGSDGFEHSPDVSPYSSIGARLARGRRRRESFFFPPPPPPTPDGARVALTPEAEKKVAVAIHPITITTSSSLCGGSAGVGGGMGGEGGFGYRAVDTAGYDLVNALAHRFLASTPTPAGATTTLTRTITPTDAGDESLQRYKESLGLGGGGKDLSDPSDPRVCIIQSLTMEAPGRAAVTIDLSAPGSEVTLKDHPFKIKEGAKFTMIASFKVQHEILSGLKYVQTVKRKGIRVSKESEMIVSIIPVVWCAFMWREMTEADDSRSSREAMLRTRTNKLSTRSDVSGSIVPNTLRKPSLLQG